MPWLARFLGPEPVKDEIGNALGLAQASFGQALERPGPGRLRSRTMTAGVSEAELGLPFLGIGVAKIGE